MYYLKGILVLVAQTLHTDLSAAQALLRGYNRRNQNTDLGNQAEALAKLCQELKAPGLLRQLLEDLSPEHTSDWGPQQWADFLEKTALPRLEAFRNVLKPPKPAPVPLGSGAPPASVVDNKREKAEAGRLFKRTASPKHEWPLELAEAVRMARRSAALLSRLSDMLKAEYKAAKHAYETAAFLAGKTTIGE